MVFDESVRSDDELFMREALLEAEQAALAGEVPVGALVVRDGEIISRAHNLVETMKSSSAHAEMLALAAAEEKLGAKWLTGAMDPKAGACGSVVSIATNDSLNHRIEITAGVLGEECSRQLKEFFRAKRDKQ